MNKDIIKYIEACKLLVPLSSLANLNLGSVYCPFHTNIHTKSASLHLDPDGVERLWCYVCKKQFTSYNYLTQILGIKDIKKYMLDRFSEEEIENAYNKLLRAKDKIEEYPIPEFIEATQFFKQLYLGI